VLHHSHWGEARWRATYETAASTAHHVIPHPHWQHVIPSRDDAEAALGLAGSGNPEGPNGGSRLGPQVDPVVDPRVRLRVGLLGAPRSGRSSQLLLDAVAAASRDDLQLVCWSLRPEDRVPDDPRIAIAEGYGFVDEGDYAQRLAVCDVLALPVETDAALLTSGVVADALQLGAPVLTCGWGYAAEVLGAGAIDGGRTARELAATLDDLTPERLAEARAAITERRAAASPERVRAQLREVLTSVARAVSPG
jgi:glycosyltransferase involved in cell wall biosynthesis